VKKIGISRKAKIEDGRIGCYNEFYGKRDSFLFHGQRWGVYNRGGFRMREDLKFRFLVSPLYPSPSFLISSQHPQLINKQR